MVDFEIPITYVHMNLNLFCQHGTQCLIVVLSTKPLVLGLYIVVNPCFTARRANRFSTTSLKNWGPLLETISNGVPNQIKIRSYRNCVIFCFTKDFKARTSANFVR